MSPDTFDHAAFGRRVRAARLAAGYEYQRHLVAALDRLGVGWAQGTMSRVESGGRSVDLHELHALSRALRVSPAHLLGLPEPTTGDGDEQAAREEWAAAAGDLHGDRYRATVRALWPSLALRLDGGQP